MSIVPRRYLNICFTPVQCLRVEAELCLANKLTENAMSGRVQLARYINAPMALRYGTSGPSNSSPLSLRRNGSFFSSNERTTMGVLTGYALSIINRLRIFLNI